MVVVIEVPRRSIKVNQENIRHSIRMHRLMRRRFLYCPNLIC